MKRNKLLLLCASILTSTILSNPFNPKAASADIYDVVYKNNAYQVNEIQDKLNNYFLGESIYSASKDVIRMMNSIRLKRTSKLRIYLEFNNSIDTIADEGYFNIEFSDDNNQIFNSYCVDIYDEHDFDELPNGMFIGMQTKSLLIIIDTSSFPSYYTLCGDEYSSTGNNFYIYLGNNANAKITKFMLDSKDDYSTTYVRPEIGKYSNSNQVYYDGDTYKKDINFDNRLSVDQILQNVIAYDYSDKKELEKEVSLDTYTDAIKNNSLGEYSFYVSTKDSSDNEAKIKFALNIIDKTAPIISGSGLISISYTELNNDGTYDVSSHFDINDNHDGKVSLDKSVFTPEKWKDNDYLITSTDSSGNKSTRNMRITVYDDVDPTIVGPSTISYYQYELGNINDILEEYTFSDGDGSGIKEKGLRNPELQYSIGIPGTYSVTLFCKDNYGNEVEHEVTLKIKDGVGPVFFINEHTLSLTNAKAYTAEEIVTQSMGSKMIEEKEYESFLFLDDNYLNNYDKEGEYDTKIVCVTKDGHKEFYRYKINVTHEIEKNVFKLLLSSTANFFTKIGAFFKYIWNSILNAI